MTQNRSTQAFIDERNVIANRIQWKRDAAEEMYDALNEALVVLESIEAKTLIGNEGCIWPAEKVRAALAKAEGRQ